MSYIKCEIRESKVEGQIAFGTVTVDNCLKFQIQVREYADKKTGEKKWFIAYPSYKGKDGEYVDLVSTKDVQLKNEIEEAVMSSLKYHITKDILLPEIEEVHLTILNKPNSNIKAKATVTINNLTIRGLSVVEGSKGMFVNMPQYKNKEGEFKDIAYGTSAAMKKKISTALLECYEKRIKDISESMQEEIDNSEKKSEKDNAS